MYVGVLTSDNTYVRWLEMLSSQRTSSSSRPYDISTPGSWATWKLGFPRPDPTSMKLEFSSKPASSWQPNHKQARKRMFNFFC